jgi:hypothetical protein
MRLLNSFAWKCCFASATGAFAGAWIGHIGRMIWDSLYEAKAADPASYFFYLLSREQWGDLVEAIFFSIVVSLVFPVLYYLTSKRSPKNRRFFFAWGALSGVVLVVSPLWTGEFLEYQCEGASDNNWYCLMLDPFLPIFVTALLMILISWAIPSVFAKPKEISGNLGTTT